MARLTDEQGQRSIEKALTFKYNEACGANVLKDKVGFEANNASFMAWCKSMTGMFDSTLIVLSTVVLTTEAASTFKTFKYSRPSWPDDPIDDSFAIEQELNKKSDFDAPGKGEKVTRTSVGDLSTEQLLQYTLPM